MLKLLDQFFTASFMFLLFPLTNAQTQTCPADNGWLKYNTKCYKFVAFPRLEQQSASTTCQTDGATLVSVNTQDEHIFIASWLLSNDQRRDTWLTSGITSNKAIRWQGDGSTSTAINYWITGNIPSEDGLRVVYNYSGADYLWSAGVDGSLYSFICEISVDDVFRIVQEPRDFDYGLNVDNPGQAPKGPTFLLEPQDTIVIGSKASSVYLDCLAQSNPPSTYEWWMISNDNIKKPLPLDTRYSFTTGMLEITNPTKADEKTYQCKATNQYGSILSSTAQLSFGEIGEFSNVPPAPVNGLEYDGAQLECPYIYGRPAKSYQWYKNEFTSFIRPDAQTHSFISANGKLFFSELAPSDQGTYFCIVTLTNFGVSGNALSMSTSESRNSLGFALSVKSGGASQYQPVIQNDFIFVYPPTPTRGGTVQLECFAYGTGPLRYTWSRENNRPLPNGYKLSSNNRVLLLSNVELADGGRYICQVFSTTTNLKDEKSYDLKIQSKPYFTYPLTHQHMDVGSRLSWHCEAAGRPTPTYEWYKNGEPLKSSPGITVDVNTLTIAAVDAKRDSGMYQCAAKNNYGITFSTAQLRVLEISPSFEKTPMIKTQAAAYGGNVTIICNPVSAPSPTYTWLKDSTNLNLVPGVYTDTDHMRVLMNGNLMIQGIQQGDQGKYTCQVENKIGKAEDYTTLKVFDKTVISISPSDQRVEVNLTATLACQASHSPDIDIIYIWKFNDHIIDYFLEPEYRQGEGSQKGSLYIIATQFKNEGKYTCLPTTGMDQQAASAYVTVMGPPGEPVGVYVQTKTAPIIDPAVNPNTTRIIMWTDGLDRGSIITNYFIEFRTDFDLRWRVHSDGNNIKQSDTIDQLFPDKRYARLTNLKAGASIQFRVKARNSFGIGDPSLPTASTQIPGTKPVAIVTNVRGGGGSVGDLTIIWDPLPKEDHNGPDLNYKVSWRSYDANTKSDVAKWQTSTVSHSTACQYVPDFSTGLIYVCRYVQLVGVQQYYSPYEVKIQAINSYGEGPSSPGTIIMSAEEMPIGAPENVFAKVFNATALMVTWKPVPNDRDSVRGKIKGYKINYWNYTNEEEVMAKQNIIELKPGQNNLNKGLIIGLEPVTWYKFNVQVYSAAGNGPKSSTYSQQTLNRVPSQYPTEVYVYSVEGFGVRVNFRGISTQKREEPLLGYKVQYWKAFENIHNAKEVDFGMLSTGVIRNLSSSQLYELRVFGYSRGGQGKRSSPSVYFTVGDGQIQINAETTEILGGVSGVKSSGIVLVIMITIWAIFI